MIGWFRNILVAGLFLSSVVTNAHLTPNSEVRLDVLSGSVTAEIIVPASEYSYASGSSADNSATALTQARQYLLDRATFSGTSGQDWTATVSSIRFARVEGPPDLFATMVFTPPKGSNPRAFQIHWRIVIDKVPDHFALFILRHDFEGKLGEDGQIIGVARHTKNVVDVELGKRSAWITFANAVKLGVQHILGGPDHLAFVVVLMLTAPLVARGRQWHEEQTMRRAIRSVATMVTGFTIGHSVTLFLAVSGDWNLPTAPVEILIALSILVTAVHALRPLFPGRELLVSSAFGLVHGLGFAGFLAKLDTNISKNAITLFGFNIGIELVQLALVLLITPIFILLTQRRKYRLLRIVLAWCAIALSVLWMVERTWDAV